MAKAKKDKKYSIIGIRLTDSEKDRFKRFADKKFMTMSSLMRKLMIEEMNRSEKHAD